MSVAQVLQWYLEQKEQHDLNVLNMFHRDEISQQIYSTLIAKSENDFKEFLKTLHHNKLNKCDLLENE